MYRVLYRLTYLVTLIKIGPQAYIIKAQCQVSIEGLGLAKF